MSIVKSIFDVLFGPDTRPSNTIHPLPVLPAQPTPDPEFSQQTLDEVARVRAGVREHFEAKRAADEQAMGLAEKKKRLERAQTYLRKAGVEAMFASIMRHTWNWEAWKEKGELDDLPRYGLEVTSVRPRQTLENHHQTKGFTIAIQGRPYDVDFLDKGRGYTPDGYGDKYGEVTITANGELLFACSTSAHSTDYGTDWNLSLYGLRVLKDVSWLTDVAEFAEIVEQRSRRRQHKWNDKRVIEQSADVIDPTKR